jgi:predicted amidohydrolase YtcJ
MLSHGITGVQEAIVRSSKHGDVYIDVWNTATTPLPKASLCLLADESKGLDWIFAFKKRIPPSIPSLRVSTVKFMLDGVVESVTAALHSPYCHDCDNSGFFNHEKSFADAIPGISYYTADLLDEFFTILVKNNWQIHCHAVGDNATTIALDALEKLSVFAFACLCGNSRIDFFLLQKVEDVVVGRHQIAHLQLVKQSDIKRFAQLGIVGNFSPFWAQRDSNQPETLRTLGGKIA